MSGSTLSRSTVGWVQSAPCESTSSDRKFVHINHQCTNCLAHLLEFPRLLRGPPSFSWYYSDLCRARSRASGGHPKPFTAARDGCATCATNAWACTQVTDDLSPRSILWRTGCSDDCPKGVRKMSLQHMLPHASFFGCLVSITCRCRPLEVMPHSVLMRRAVMRHCSCKSVPPSGIP